MSDRVTLLSSASVDPLPTFAERLQAPITAKQATLTALTATGTPLSTAQIRSCGALFDVEGSAMRVALGRLVEDGLVAASGDGTYAIGAKGRGLADAIERWRDLPQLIRPWTGTWIAIHTAHLGRTKRGQLRRRERALSLFGFAARHPGLWLRPDNLSLEPGAMHERLLDLGLEAGATMLTGASLQGDVPLAELWDRTALESGYQAAEDAMQACLDGFETLDVEQRARQTARIGRVVVALLTFDPLLPEPMVDAELRRGVHRRMLKFDRVGKKALARWWRVAA